MAVQGDDKLIIHRGGKDYQVEAQDFEKKLQDDDLVLTSRGGVDYKVRGADFKKVFEETTYPWDDHIGGVWHIVNPTDRMQTPQNADYPYYDVNGNYLGQIDKSGIPAGVEIVFLTGQDAHSQFQSGTSANWEFGPLTDTSKVTSMNYLFAASQFDNDISDWDVSSVITMNHMFEKASKFNHPIGAWDVSNVTEMRNMFEDAEAFNQDISGWDTSSVTKMDYMFWKAKAFTSNLSTWDVQLVTVFNSMFENAEAFDAPIGVWNTKNALSMSLMFANTKTFNQDLREWCVPYLNQFTNSNIFQNATAQNQYTKPIWGTCPRGENQ